MRVFHNRYIYIPCLYTYDTDQRIEYTLGTSQILIEDGQQKFVAPQWAFLY